MNPRLLPSLSRSLLRIQSDERLTELARSGSREAFEAIVARHRRSLVRHCAQVAGTDDADEAVQNALLNAHLALTRGEEVRNVRAWLHRIARNEALRLLQARGSRAEFPVNSDFAEAAVDTVGTREQLRDVVDAVKSLPARQRNAIVMRELEGRSYDEIALRLGATHGAVRQLLSRARSSVRERLGAFGGLEALLRLSGGSGTARLGALSAGCAATIKICAAFVPVTVLPGLIPVAPRAIAHPRASTLLRVPHRPKPATTRARRVHALPGDHASSTPTTAKVTRLTAPAAQVRHSATNSVHRSSGTPASISTPATSTPPRSSAPSSTSTPTQFGCAQPTRQAPPSKPSQEMRAPRADSARAPQQNPPAARSTPQSPAPLEPSAQPQPPVPTPG